MVDEKKIEEKAKALAIQKLKLEAARVSPEIGETKSFWVPGVLRKVSEVEVRAAEQSVVARIDAETGETLGWRYPKRAISSPIVKLTEEEAIRIARSEVEIPSDAQLDGVELLNRGVTGSVYIVKWKHVVDGIPVEDDFIAVKINPETKEVVSATKNWSVIGQ